MRWPWKTWCSKGSLLFAWRLPSTCSYIQMSLLAPWEVHSLWKTIFSPSDWCRDIQDSIKGLQRGMICLHIMPHYQSISNPPLPTKDSEAKACVYLSQRFDRVKHSERKSVSEKHHIINDAYSVWLVKGEKNCLTCRQSSFKMVLADWNASSPAWGHEVCFPRVANCTLWRTSHFHVGCHSKSW